MTYLPKASFFRALAVDTTAVYQETKVDRPYKTLPSTYGLPHGARISLPRAKHGGRHTVALLTGDGVSPEMMEHIKSVYYALDAPVNFDEVIIDNNSDEEVMREAILAVQRNGVALKGSIKTIPGEEGGCQN